MLSLVDSAIDRQKAIDCLFDSSHSDILAELESGEKDLSYLASKSEMSGDQILASLSYLIETDILVKSVRDDKIYLNADSEKLSRLMESDENFEGAVDGLTKMDSYLN